MDFYFENFPHAEHGGMVLNLKKPTQFFPTRLVEVLPQLLFLLKYGIGISASVEVPPQLLRFGYAISRNV